MTCLQSPPHRFYTNYVSSATISKRKMLSPDRQYFDGRIKKRKYRKRVYEHAAAASAEQTLRLSVAAPMEQDLEACVTSSVEEVPGPSVAAPMEQDLGDTGTASVEQVPAPSVAASVEQVPGQPAAAKNQVSSCSFVFKSTMLVPSSVHNSRSHFRRRKVP